MRVISADERRARLVARHGLASAGRPTTVLGAAEAMVALHATDPSSVYLSVAARVPDVTIGDIERALYDERVVLRMLGMRRTV